MRLIDRDELMSVISEIEPVVEFEGPIEEVKVKGEKYEKVRHGKWESIGTDLLKCSECDFLYINYFNYCPNCGAKMDGGTDNETD